MDMNVLEVFMRYLDALQTVVLWALFFAVSGYLMAGFLVYKKIKEGKKNESL